MKKFRLFALVLFIIFLFSGCFLGGHINSGGSVGMSVGGNIF